MLHLEVVVLLPKLSESLRVDAAGRGRVGAPRFWQTRCHLIGQLYDHLTGNSRTVSTAADRLHVLLSHKAHRKQEKVNEYIYSSRSACNSKHFLFVCQLQAVIQQHKTRIKNRSTSFQPFSCCVGASCFGSGRKKKLSHRASYCLDTIRDHWVEQLIELYGHNACHT